MPKIQLPSEEQSLNSQSRCATEGIRYEATQTRCAAHLTAAQSPLSILKQKSFEALQHAEGNLEMPFSDHDVWN